MNTSFTGTFSQEYTKTPIEKTSRATSKNTSTLDIAVAYIFHTICQTLIIIQSLAMIRSVEVLYSFGNALQNSLFTLLGHLVNFFIDIVFVTEKERTHEAVVALEGKIGKRMEKKHGDCHPEYHVEKFVEEEPQERREYFSQRKENPIIEVTNIVLFICAFESEEGKVSWHQVAHQASQ